MEGIPRFVWIFRIQWQIQSLEQQEGGCSTRARSGEGWWGSLSGSSGAAPWAWRAEHSREAGLESRQKVKLLWIGWSTVVRHRHSCCAGQAQSREQGMSIIEGEKPLPWAPSQICQTPFVGRSEVTAAGSWVLAQSLSSSKVLAQIKQHLCFLFIKMLLLRLMHNREKLRVLISLMFVGYVYFASAVFHQHEVLIKENPFYSHLVSIAVLYWEKKVLR